MASPSTPLLVFDGDCGFCRYWVERWRARVGDRVQFIPYQDPSVAARLPDVPREQFRNAVQLLEPDGALTSGAEAVFRLLAVGDLRGPRWAYENLPLVAPLTEAAYAFIARHRPWFARATTALWGPVPARPTYASGTWLFLRLLGLSYLCAFWSLGVQVRGLIGHDGILPADRFMEAAHRWAAVQEIGVSRWFALPTVFWFGTSDAALIASCVSGALLAGLVTVGICARVLLPVLWLLYLSLSTVAREFLSYQWDTLLLEGGIVGALLTPSAIFHRPRDPEPPTGARCLVWWLTFRLMLGSGIAKLASGDSTWHDLTAMAFHFETQPLPTPLAWYAHQLPVDLQRALTAIVLFVELALPWLVWTPRRLRHVAGIAFVGLQVAIASTGNYAFFNLVTLALSLSLLDDQLFRRPRAIAGPAPGPVRRVILTAAALLIVPLSAVLLASQARIRLPGTSLVAPVYAAAAPFRSVNMYGLFAVMTTTRPEIVVEGSADGIAWKAYEFRYKPGDVSRRPPWVAPHQPRLDWQMWFAALGPVEGEPWFRAFCERLLKASPAVRSLLARDPFPGAPPKFVRATLYEYRFADRETRRRTRAWWVRDGPRPYYGPVSREVVKTE